MELGQLGEWFEHEIVCTICNLRIDRQCWDVLSSPVKSYFVPLWSSPAFGACHSSTAGPTAFCRLSLVSCESVMAPQAALRRWHFPWWKVVVWLWAACEYKAKIHGLLLFSRCGLWEGWSCYELLDFVWVWMCWIVDHWKLAATKWTGKRTRKRAEPLACEDGKPARHRHSGRTICAILNRQLLDDLMLRSPWCIAWWPLFKYRTTNWVRLESQHLHHI